MMIRSLFDSISTLIPELHSTRDAANRQLLAEQLRNVTLRTRESLLSRGDLLTPAKSPISEMALKKLIQTGQTEREDSTLSLIIESMGDIGTVDTVPFLSRTLTVKNESVAVTAAASLGEIGGEDASQALIAIAQSRSTCDRAVSAVTALEGLAAKTGLSSSLDVKSHVAGALLDTFRFDHVDEFIKLKIKNVLELAGVDADAHIGIFQCA